MAERFENGIHLVDEDGTPVADRRLCVIDGRVTVVNPDDSVEGAYLSPASIEAILATFQVPAGAMHASSTAGATGPLQKEFGTNKVNLVVMRFPQSVTTYAEVLIHMPGGYDGGTFINDFCWTAESGSGDVIWGIQARSLTNDDAIDQAWGTAKEVTDTLLLADDYHKSPATAAVTPAGTPAGGQCMVYRVYRKGADAGDTLLADVDLIAFSPTYTKAVSDG